MKRTIHVPGAQDPDFDAAVTAAYPPGQKRQARDVCKKGTDGSGYLEGKVFERAIASGESLNFIMTVELGYRAYVSLSSSIPHLSTLPLAVGAQVRLGLRGLSLEDIPREELHKLGLPKRFTWIENATVYVNHPNGEAEAFISTCGSESPSRGASSTSSLEAVSALLMPAVPKKRRRTPSSTGPQEGSVGVEPGNPAKIARTDSPASRSHSSAPSNGVPAVDPEPMDVDPPVVTAAITERKSASHTKKPQSKPLPPTETNTPQAREDGTTVPPKERTPTNTTTSSRSSSEADSSKSVPPQQQPKSKSRTRSPSAPEARRSTRQLKARSSKVLLRKQLRQDKKSRKKHESHTAQRPQSMSPEEEDQYLWDNVGPEVPYELLDRISQTNVELEAQAAPPEPDPPQPMESDEVPAPPEPEVVKQVVEQVVEQDIVPVSASQYTEESNGIVYTPLAQCHGMGPYNIMGVIDGPGTLSTTRTGEHMLKLVMFDESNSGTNGLRISLFEKNKLALPNLQAGDLLMIRLLQCDTHGTAVGASYKTWQWTALRTSTGRMPNVPADHDARQFKPAKHEMLQFLKLGDWWRSVSANAITFAPGRDSARNGRSHKLIGEATDEGYFDCTVEILHTARISEWLFAVYVTDYTHNAQASSTHGTWCPAQYADVVLHVEFSHTSYDTAATMQPGEYYCLRNIRLKLGPSGYVEGRMQEAHKITKLDEDDLENQPHLTELLKRKKEWEAKVKTSGGVHEFPHQLVEEAQENCHFTCTVEIVHISAKETCNIYITDYTARPDLVPVAATIAPDALAGRVVRVALSDAQTEAAQALDAGDFLTVRNLRLRTAGGTLLSGRLGGDQRLLAKLNPKASASPELRALMRRREAFLAAQEGAAAARKQGKKRREGGAKAESVPKENGKGKGKQRADVVTPPQDEAAVEGRVSLAEVKAHEECPAVFRVRARIVDFFPDNLRDCVIRRCSQCEKTIPDAYLKCSQCDDAMDDESSVEAFFQLHFRLEDEEGTELYVSVSDERCSVLQDLVPEDVYEEEEAFNMLVARVKPLLGDLLEVTDGEARRRPIAQDEEAEGGALLNFTLGSWLPTSEPDTPDSRMYVILQHSE